MFLLDTNAFQLYLAGEPNMVHQVQQHIVLIQLSSIACEETLTGSMNRINRARSTRNSLSLPRAHADFVQNLEDFRPFPTLVYSEEAEAIFRTFSPATLRIGPQDCRIAAQALAHDLTVVTRNLRDFFAIGAPCIDWSHV